MLGLISIVLALAPVQGANTLTPAEAHDGFKLLFNGADYASWTPQLWGPKASKWLVQDGTITWDRGGGSWLRSNETYEDFILRLEYRTGGNSNSGIFLRAFPGDKAVNRIELQILDDHGKPPGIHCTGSLYGAVVPGKNMAKPPGEWNTVEARMIGRRLVAIWNGEEILDVNLDDPRYQQNEHSPLGQRPSSGYIGLQGYVNIAPVGFRNIRIKVLKAGASQ